MTVHPAVYTAIRNRSLQMIERNLFSMGCGCMGPEPGHTLCPCAERRKDAHDAIATLAQPLIVYAVPRA